MDVWKSLPNFTPTIYIKHFTMIQDILSTMSVNEVGELVNRLQPKQVSLLEEVAIESPETAEEKAWGVWSVKAARKKAGEEEPDEDDDEDVPAEEEDDWEKGEEGEEEADEWDPDFDEFDIPKSTKKAAGGKKDADEEEDVKFDEDLNEFDDLFGDSGGDGFDDDDDF